MFFRFFLLFCLLLSSIIGFGQAENNGKSFIAEIKLIGNNTTKDHIALRELTFKMGDSLETANLKSEFEQSKNNLINTFLFNFVRIDYVQLNETDISVYVNMEERWYLWPFPIFEIQETNLNTWWKDKDLNRVNYGFFVTKENFRGRRETLLLKFQKGYTEQFGFKYNVPNFNEDQTRGIGVTASYSRNHEIRYQTQNNKREFVKDNDLFLKEEFYSAVNFSIRPKYYNRHSFQLEFSSLSIGDTVTQLRPDYLGKDGTKTQFLSAGYHIVRDLRNNKNYPLKGYYFDLEIVKDGLGIVDPEINSLYTQLWIKRFYQLHQKWYYSSSIKLKTSIINAPYFLQGTLGFGNNVVRGYEYYVIEGNNSVLLKNQLRFGLIQNKIFKFDFIPLEQFNKVPFSSYLGVFYDLGYMDSPYSFSNTLNNELLFGGGLSLDLVSYYDMVMRTEFSINKLGEKGIFIHFVAPI